MASPILLVRTEQMIEKSKIMEIADGLLQDSDKYMVDLQVKPGNIITVIIDGDSAVTIDDCMQLSRGIEKKLDRDQEDFELRVTSFGADKPLKLKRQYRKNIGRKVEILTSDDTRLTGKLLEVTDDHVVIEPEVLKKDKNQEPAQKVQIGFNNIKQTKIVLSFK